MIHSAARLAAVVAITAAPAVSWRMLRASARTVAVESRDVNIGKAARPTHTDAQALERFATADDPFRRDHRPPRARFGEAVVIDAPPAPMPPRPVLTLTGILSGASPSLVLEGVPGREGASVARVGDTLGGLRIMAIGPESVTITGFDTTWQLRLRIPWR